MDAGTQRGGDQGDRGCRGCAIGMHGRVGQEPGGTQDAGDVHECRGVGAGRMQGAGVGCVNAEGHEGQGVMWGQRR